MGNKHFFILGLTNEQICLKLTIPLQIVIVIYDTPENKLWIMHKVISLCTILQLHNCLGQVIHLTKGPFVRQVYLRGNIYQVQIKNSLDYCMI